MHYPTAEHSLIGLAVLISRYVCSDNFMISLPSLCQVSLFKRNNVLTKQNRSYSIPYSSTSTKALPAKILGLSKKVYDSAVVDLIANSSREIQTSVSSAINNISNHSPPQVEKIRNKVDRSLKTQGLLLPAVTVNPSVIIPEEVYLRGVEMHTELISCFFSGRTPYKQIKSVINHMWVLSLWSYSSTLPPPPPPPPLKESHFGLTSGMYHRKITFLRV
ncbi:hypothetical protein YC2023_036815 [Brassica napus]